MKALDFTKQTINPYEVMQNDACAELGGDIPSPENSFSMAAMRDKGILFVDNYPYVKTKRERVERCDQASRDNVCVRTGAVL